ncbi:MAG: hypothetical protein R6X18_12045 [Chloroflexota bacterium]|jgi:hypothetical protein
MSTPPGTNRPLGIRFAQWVTVILGLWNMGRVAALGRQVDWLSDLSLVPDPRLRIVMAFIWMALFLMAAFALQRGYSWSRFLVPLLIAVYGVFEIGMIALYATDPPALLPVLLYIALTTLVVWFLWRPATAAYFNTQEMRR